MSNPNISGGCGDTAAKQALKPSDVRMSHFLSMAASGTGGVKGGMPVAGARPIAPSPVQVSATQLIAGAVSQTFPNMPSNVQLLGIGGTGDQAQMQIKNALQMRAVPNAGNQSQALIQSSLAAHHANTGQSQGMLHAASANISQSQPLIQTGLVSQSQALVQAAGAGLHASGGGLIQQNVTGNQSAMIATRGVSSATMASLIKSGQVHVTQAVVTHANSTVTSQHGFQSPHLPRGPAAVSALAGAGPHKTLATPMLRAQPQHVITTAQPHQAISATNTGGVRPILPGRTHTLTPQQLRGGGGAAMVTVAATPSGAVTVTNVLTQKQNTAGHHSATTPTELHHKMGGGSIQISVQQQRNPGDILARPTLSKLQAKPIHHPQQIKTNVQNNSTQPSPKVLMSPMQTPLAISADKINPAAVRLSMQGGNVVLRPPSHKSAHAPGTAHLHQTGVAGGGMAVAPVGPRAQKIIMSQSSAGQSLSSGTIITTVARTVSSMSIRPQKVVVSHIQSMPNTHHTSANQPPATAKVVGGSLANSSTSLPSVHGGTVHGPLVAAGMQHGGAPSAGQAPTSTPHAPPGTTIPIAKVPPQRQAVLHTAMLQVAAQQASNTDMQPHPQHHRHTSAPTQPSSHHPQMVHSQQQSHGPHPGMLLQPRTVVTSGSQNDTSAKPGPPVSQSERTMSYIPAEAYALMSPFLNNQAMAAAAAMAASAGHSAGHGAGQSAGQPGAATRQPLVSPGARINPNTLNSMILSTFENRTINAQPQDGHKKEQVATMASAHLQNAMTSSSGNTGHVTQVSTNQQPASSQQNSNVPASPRPSILRKRTYEGLTPVKRQIFNSSGNALQEAPPPHTLANSNLAHPHASNNHQPTPAASNHDDTVALSPKSSILDPSRENSQSSTDTASSNESTPGKGKVTNNNDVKVKAEPNADGPVENGEVSSVPNNEATPRKKPRKQMLHVTSEDVKQEKAAAGEAVADDETVAKFSRTVHVKRERELAEEEHKPQPTEVSELVDEDGVRWVRERRRPPIALLNHYQCSWKPKNNHFLRYTDVKPKDERRPTVNELANQKHVHQKCSGWKMYHLAAQVEDLIDLEDEVLKKMLVVKDKVAPKHSTKASLDDDQLSMVHELSQGNIQRNRLFIDQMNEARTSLIKILDHKKRILGIVTKHHSKRPVKKKERS